MSYQSVLLNTTHKKSEFYCGISLLDNYLHKQAKQDSSRYLTACFVIVNHSNEIKGYYTLSNSSIDSVLLPEKISVKLPPSYHNLPVTLLGRLARDTRFKNERLGEVLLLDALQRSYDASFTIGSMAVIVNPINETARNFYLKYGFIDIPDTDKMFMSMKLISTLFIT